MADLKTMYEKSTSPTITVAKAMGGKDGNAGVNFFDGTGRGPWSPTFKGETDTFQTGIVENKMGSTITPAASNDGTYPLTRWKDDALKIAFENKGPAKLKDGYWGNSRFTVFKDSAGRWTDDGSKLHKYAPLKGKAFGDMDEWAKNRIKAGATSTAAGGLNG